MELNEYKINNCFISSPLDLGGVKLIQAGRYYCHPGAVIQTSLHSDFYELTVVTDGKGTVLTNGEAVEVGKHDVYVSFPFDRHGILSSETEPLKYDHLAFSIENKEYSDALKQIASEYYSPKLRIVSDPKIDYLAQRIVAEFGTKKYLYKEAVKNDIYNIAVYIVRAFNEKGSPELWGDSSEAEIFCNRIMNYIDTNVYDIENLQSLAAVTGYNYNYLSTLFKKTTSINLRDYFLSRKLEVADMLFKEGKLSVCRIAEKLGYSSGAALSKAYKKKYGRPPSSVKSVGL